ncbi:LysE family translocator [Bermanella sp. R86510]|uniref:LysE family translocator n=1 Tax=unclassified Bermanella TaxID=2627862 RepID=UPI0037C9ECCE
MLNTGLLAAFVPTFVVVSLTPGMCMTLAMSMGMTIGVRKALWMMLGELTGVGLVATLSVLGVAAIMLQAPEVFVWFKWIGGAYLGWLGIQMWQSKGNLAMPESPDQHGHNTKPLALISQGFITAVANPKGWAFFVVFLPPFIDVDKAMAPQLTVLTLLLLSIEFISLLLYANGGKALAKILTKTSNVQTINRISGTLMMGVGVWLALG